MKPVAGKVSKVGSLQLLGAWGYAQDCVPDSNARQPGRLFLQISHICGEVHHLIAAAAEDKSCCRAHAQDCVLTAMRASLASFQVPHTA